MTVVVTGVSGWALVLLLPVTIALPFVLRRRPSATVDGRLRPHYWMGYGVAALTLAHAAVSTGGGLALRVDPSGVTLATGALLLVIVQVFVGLLLREPSLRRRPLVRRWHVWGMVGIVALALGHIALNSALLHALRGM